MRGALGGLVHSSPTAGWVARTPGVQREPFFCSVPPEWGQLLLSRGLCPPSGETVQGSPPSLSTQPPSLSHRTRHYSLDLTYPSIHPSIHPSAVPDQLGVAQCFVEAQESEQTSSRRKRGLLLCQLPGKSAFYCH